MPIIEKAKTMYKKMNYGYKIDMLSLTQVIVFLYLQDQVGADETLDRFNNFSSDEY